MKELDQMDRIATPPSSSKKSRGLQILQEMGVETPATKKSKNLSSNQTSPPTAAADAGLKSRSPGGRVLQIEHSHLLKVLGVQIYSLYLNVDDRAQVSLV